MAAVQAQAPVQIQDDRRLRARQNKSRFMSRLKSIVTCGMSANNLPKENKEDKAARNTDQKTIITPPQADVADKQQEQQAQQQQVNGAADKQLVNNEPQEVSTPRHNPLADGEKFTANPAQVDTSGVPPTMEDGLMNGKPTITAYHASSGAEALVGPPTPMVDQQTRKVEVVTSPHVKAALDYQQRKAALPPDAEYTVVDAFTSEASLGPIFDSERKRGTPEPAEVAGLAETVESLNPGVAGLADMVKQERAVLPERLDDKLFAPAAGSLAPGVAAGLPRMIKEERAVLPEELGKKSYAEPTIKRELFKAQRQESQRRLQEEQLKQEQERETQRQLVEEEQKQRQLQKQQEREMLRLLEVEEKRQQQLQLQQEQALQLLREEEDQYFVQVSLAVRRKEEPEKLDKAIIPVQDTSIVPVQDTSIVPVHDSTNKAVAEEASAPAKGLLGLVLYGIGTAYYLTGATLGTTAGIYSNIVRPILGGRLPGAKNTREAPAN